MVSNASRHRYDAVELVRLDEPGRIAVKFRLGLELVQEWSLSDEAARELGGLLLDISADSERHRSLPRRTGAL